MKLIKSFSRKLNKVLYNKKLKSFRRYYNNIHFKYKKGNDAYFDEKNKIIVIGDLEYINEADLIHEMTHYIDAYENRKFDYTSSCSHFTPKLTFKDQLIIFYNTFYPMSIFTFNDTFDKIVKNCKKYFKFIKNEELKIAISCQLADIFITITGGRYNNCIEEENLGHDREYFKVSFNKMKELHADYNSLSHVIGKKRLSNIFKDLGHSKLFIKLDNLDRWFRDNYFKK